MRVVDSIPGWVRHAAQSLGGTQRARDVQTNTVRFIPSSYAFLIGARPHCGKSWDRSANTDLIFEPINENLYYFLLRR